MFKTAWEKADFKPHRILESGKDGNYTYILNWNWVKWYREFEDVSEIMKVCYELDEKDEDGYAYKVIEIEKDNATKSSCLRAIKKINQQKNSAIDALCDWEG